MALINKLSAIGDAIREKNGTTALMTLDEMPEAIAAIETGGGGGELPEEVFLITGDCEFRFGNDGWNWFIETYGNKIITKDITNVGSMFSNSINLKNIPFKINIQELDSPTPVSNLFNYCKNLKTISHNIDFKHTTKYVEANYIFYECRNLKQVPYLYNLYPGSITHLFGFCYNLREIPEDYFDTWNFSRLHSYNYAGASNIFNNCYSLRKIPKKLLKEMEKHVATGSYNTFLSNAFSGCYCLDEITDMTVLNSTLTVNMFSGTFSRTARLKNLIFSLNEDGTIKVVNWKSQNIDLSDFVGYVNFSAYCINYNSGITADKEVKDDITYQALKNDPDWFTSAIAYSRYNHDSAVATINSLPDASAYLATAGGTNTIKFKSGSGSLTDGGAINTLTEAEIAVAAAKGWTVTLV